MRVDLSTIRLLADMISDSDDRDTELGFLDTLEGECDVMEVADYLIGLTLEADALVIAAKAQAQDLKTRADRMEWRAKQRRAALRDLLSAVGVKKLERPRATISLRAGSESVAIEDESAIPSQLCTVKTTTMPDKAAIKAQIKAGVDVPGAILTRGSDTVSMRVV